MTTLSLRRHDIDWLRIFAVYLLFVFHTAMVFNPAPFYHVRNAELSTVALIAAGFISLWHMPLFFLLAGWSAYASLSARGTAAFLGERVRKLWVPLVVGCVVLMPPIKYLELRGGLDASYTGLRASPALQEGFRQIIPSGLPTMAPFDETFWQFLPTFFTRLERVTWAHLWFIAYLLLFTLVYLPLFRRLSAHQGELQNAPRWWVYLPIVLIAALVIRLELGIAAKYTLILVTSLAATLAVYHFGIRPFVLTRLCVGMKASPRRVRGAGWRRAAAAALTISLSGACLPRAAAAVPPTPLGRWYAEGGAAQVEIAPCDEALCGRVVWLRSPFDEHGCGLLDRYNDDPALRARPIVGLGILRDLRQSEHDPRVWERGSIYDPTSGRTYACRLTVLDDGDRLELRGYLGVPLLGRTTTWIRVGAEERVCQAAAPQ